MIYILEQDRESITVVNSTIRINEHDRREIIVHEGEKSADGYMG